MREALHIALAFSPIGDSFKNRIRVYPSLINCCTIDWFTAWPDDALQKVAENFIKSMDLVSSEHSPPPSLESVGVEGEGGSEDEIRERKLTTLEKNLVDMVMTFNISVVAASKRFFAEQGRINYVTPTSYLEMLRSFSILYRKKYSEITAFRDRLIEYSFKMILPRCKNVLPISDILQA